LVENGANSPVDVCCILFFICSIGRQKLKNFNLACAQWIPVERLKGDMESIAPHEITSQHDTNPVIGFVWPRPDLDLASYEFLIGLLAAIYPADPRKSNEWTELFHAPPSPDQLATAFEPFADAFVLDGNGPRFLQDFEPLEGEELPIESLLIEAPGANTIKLNKDLFIKRGQARIFSRGAAAIALYTLQQFAPSGGAGHRTSLRGGGPLVTLALPNGAQASRATLWQRLWLNTPADLRLDVAEKTRAFPWLAPTRTSAKKQTVHEADAHRLQSFFGMPRRIRLSFSENFARRPCDLTGKIDDIVCTGFTTLPWGVNYGIWRHPTTPYYKPKANSNDPDLPVHAPEGRLGYRQWLGLVFQGNKARAADAILRAKDRLYSLGRPWKDNSRLLAGGYAMDNMKALAFAEAEMPLHSVDPKLAQEIEKFARNMIDAATIAASIVGIAIRRALFGSKTEVKLDQTVLDTARERFWATTEADFHKTLDAALSSLAGDSLGDEQDKVAQAWRGCLERAAFGIFDDTVPIDSFDELDPEDIVEGRKLLVLSLKGYGKLGVDLFKALGIDLPEPKGKTRRTSKAKTKAEISQ
jgi:CRISPR system Cascade subunit CasA